MNFKASLFIVAAALALPLWIWYGWRIEPENGYDFDASDAEFTDMVLKVASGRMLKAEITLFFRQHTHPRK